MPVVGVIEPGVRAARAGHRRRAGSASSAPSAPSRRVPTSGPWRPPAPTSSSTRAACPGFVEFVERGETERRPGHVLAERLLAPVKDADVDALLLGCTHYPYLARVISDVMGRDVVLVSARPTRPPSRCRRLLDELGLRRSRRRSTARPSIASTRPGDVALVRGARPPPARPRAGCRPAAALRPPLRNGRRRDRPRRAVEPSAQRPARSTGHRPKELTHAPP